MKIQTRLLMISLTGMVLLTAVLIWRSMHRRTSHPVQLQASIQETTNTPTHSVQPLTNTPVFSEHVQREVPNAAERWLRLERLGGVPQDADDWDWWLAKKTTWWGKRLDPKQFWKGRTVWLDKSATMAAQRQGRMYPPIPYHDQRFDLRQDEDQSTMPSADSTDIGLRYSDKENAFWNDFTKKHPIPPEQIFNKQSEMAHTILGTRHRFLYGGNPGRWTQSRLDASDQIQRERMHDSGYPLEAFTDEALHWVYVNDQRAEYEEHYLRRQLDTSRFLSRIWVDQKLVTDPLTDEQLQAANAWKVTYLQRMRRENVDESYINAYLKAWNLTAEKVFTKP